MAKAIVPRLDSYFAKSYIRYSFPARQASVLLVTNQGNIRMNRYYRPRRSMLYVPGCSARYLNKARSLRVDSVILDLGDPILVELKEASRRLVAEALLSGGYGR